MTESTSNWSAYSFVQNNPLLYLDPLGLDTVINGQNHQWNGGFLDEVIISGKNEGWVIDASGGWDKNSDPFYQSWKYGDPAYVGSLLKDAWNSDVARIVIPDFVHIGIGFSGFGVIGTSVSIEINLALRGDQAFKPLITSTTTVGLGYQVDATFNIGSSNYLGPVSDITTDLLVTSIGKGKAGIFGSIGGSVLGKVGLTGTWTPTPTGFGLFQKEVNLGLGLLPGLNGAGGASNTYILWDSK